MKKSILRLMAVGLALAAMSQTVYKAVAVANTQHVSIDQHEQVIVNFIKKQRKDRTNGVNEIVPVGDQDVFLKSLREYLRTLEEDGTIDSENGIFEKAENPGI